MVTSSSFGLVLSFVDKAGVLQKADPVSDPDKFSAFTQTYSDQQNAPSQNQTAFNNYAQAVANYNQSLDAGRPMAPFALKPPQKLLVGDPTQSGGKWFAGLNHYVDFDNLPQVGNQPVPAVSQGIAVKLTSPTSDQMLKYILQALLAMEPRIEALEAAAKK